MRHYVHLSVLRCVEVATLCSASCDYHQRFKGVSWVSLLSGYDKAYYNSYGNLIPSVFGRSYNIVVLMVWCCIFNMFSVFLNLCFSYLLW